MNIKNFNDLLKEVHEPPDICKKCGNYVSFCIVLDSNVIEMFI